MLRATTVCLRCGFYFERSEAYRVLLKLSVDSFIREDAAINRVITEGAAAIPELIEARQARADVDRRISEFPDSLRYTPHICPSDHTRNFADSIRERTTNTDASHRS